MEPIGFFKSSDFLSGSIEEFNEHEMIDNKDRALKLLFDQNIPDNYMVWSDFFSDLVSKLYLYAEYKKAIKDILNRIRISTKDQVKKILEKKMTFYKKETRVS
ncbi:hypothetical protein [Photorhabdus namnaonensis]|uniref:Uncharacterized protein n=1 Tax=Photorhabdus namnaonensis TaxID=1851568 RepID=A0A1B8YJT4_9GAMM|nr:hypothetical protein [Photorhabdus namnaonensis]OCA55327.1 hypothetical protein Phpb_01585 [Photorhabdus namnaonensis]